MEIHTLEPILAEQPFFRDMKKEHLELLAGCAANVKYEAGEFIFRQNDEADQFFLLREGRIVIEISAIGLEPLGIQTLHAGEVFGWSWLFPPYRWTFDARAIEKTRALAMDGTCLRTKCADDHDLGYDLLQRFSGVVVDRLESTRIQLLDIYGAPTRRG